MSEHQPQHNPFQMIQVSGYCVVCKCMLGPSPGTEGRTCFQLRCQQELKRRKSEGFGQPKCSHCSISITVHQHGTGGICGDHHCRNARLRHQQQETAKHHFLVKQQHIAALKQKMEGVVSSTSHFLEIPAFQRELIPLTQARRELLHAHLLELFEEVESAQSADATDTPDDPGTSDEPTDTDTSAFSDDSPASMKPDPIISLQPDATDDVYRKAVQSEMALPEAAQPEVAQSEAVGPVEEQQESLTTSDALIGYACRTCQGFCCRRGEEHAYLKVDTIQSMMQRTPTLSPDAIIEHYLSSLSEEVYEGSCIFHAERGCRLTAEWRSTTCNDYFCGPMHNFLARANQPGQEIVALATSEQEIVRAARYSQTEYHSLDISSLTKATEDPSK